MREVRRPGADPGLGAVLTGVLMTDRIKLPRLRGGAAIRRAFAATSTGERKLETLGNARAYKLASSACFSFHIPLSSFFKLFLCVRTNELASNDTFNSAQK